MIDIIKRLLLIKRKLCIPNARRLLNGTVGPFMDNSQTKRDNGK